MDGLGERWRAPGGYREVLRLAAPAIGATALSGFFSGVGRALPLVWITITAIGANIALDYALIFGRWGFPEWGIQGAAVATVVASSLSLVLHLAVTCRPANNRRYRTAGGWRFDRSLFGCLARFGLPSAVHFVLQVSAVAAFVLVVGKLGRDALAATNIALNVYLLAFMPVVGLGMAVTVLVGQYLGKDEPELARGCVYSGLHAAAAFMGVLVVPTYVAVVWLGAGLYVGWDILVANASALSVAFCRRFLGGKWKSMRVIEAPPPDLAPERQP